MKRLILISIFLFSFSFFWSGCSKKNTESVYLRIINHTDKDFSSVDVSFNGIEAQYNSISAGDTGNFQKLKKIYRYGYVRATADNLTFESAHPTDYVGESPLKSGKYNAILTLSNDGYHDYLIMDIE